MNYILLRLVYRRSSTPPRRHGTPHPQPHHDRNRSSTKGSHGRERRVDQRPRTVRSSDQGTTRSETHKESTSHRSHDHQRSGRSERHPRSFDRSSDSTRPRSSTTTSYPRRPSREDRSPEKTKRTGRLSMETWREKHISSRFETHQVTPPRPSKKSTPQRRFQDKHPVTPWRPQSFKRTPMDLYTQGSGEIVTINSSTDATPRSQSIESNYTPSCRRRDRTPPQHKTKPRERFIQPPERTQRTLYPPILPFPVETPPVPAVLRQKIPREVLLFYDQLNETKLSQVRGDDPQADDLTKKEIFRWLALTEQQLNDYYELPVVTDTSTCSEAYVNFVSTLDWKIVGLFWP